ncbi:MAG: ATP phosphoribosyltransferase [Acidobacteriota bacterium]
MTTETYRLKLALQKNGRITDESIALLRASGLDFEFTVRSLFSPCTNFPLDVLSLRDDDIPEYVQDGVSDLGIVGANVVEEKGAKVRVVERLGFGKCRLAICVPKNGSLNDLDSLKGKRIATSYPKTLGRFLSSMDIEANIIEISGSVEITPALNVADATCDILSTGSTARVNGLEPMLNIMESEAVLIANERVLESVSANNEIDRLLTRIRSSLRARGKKYVMMNAPLSSVEKLKQLVPGMKSPTVVPLANREMVAIQSVVGEEVLWEVIEQLKRAGASDIVVTSIEKIIP